MTDGLMDPSTPTLASGAPPAAAPPAAREPAPENPRARGHSPARDTYERLRNAQEQQPVPGAPPVAAADPQQPSADGEKIKIGKYEVSEQEFGAMMERQALDDLRKATVPPSPDSYKLEISPGAKLPGDAKFMFDASDPSLAAARNWAHGKGLDQSAFSEMLTLYASHVAGQEAQLAARARAEIAKAGVNAGQRVDAVRKWIIGMVGEEDAKPICATLVTDAHLRFHEKIINQTTSQGTAAFSQSHRVPPDSKAIPGYETMSFEQRRFAQDQRATRGR